MGGVQKKQRIGTSKTCVWDAISVHGLTTAGERSPLPNKAHEARPTEPSHVFPVDLDVQCVMARRACQLPRWTTGELGARW